ncbi:isochorismatase family protein [Nocardioides sp. KC13]|uniref:Isochorismatase family protein n=1 Tax=Nocardioides turkmenicus TaxID=2711220 RepID=A0A6M1RAX5_9ACTN|nr:isochorismatase family protein [Nocardioides sp. KC13]NGN93487.1 isochorismatase family protein [Nocardioides sp. KC13]
MSNRALIVIDIQESFRQLEAWPQTLHPDIAERAERLVSLARAAGDLVVWVLHTEPGSGGAFDPASGHVRYLDGLSGPREGEVAVRKTSHNPFTTTNLQQVLTQHGVTELVVCGIRAEQCVETTARVGFDLGYQVTYVADAVTTEPLGGLSAEEVVERTKLVLSGRFAEIATIAELEAVAASAA